MVVRCVGKPSLSPSSFSTRDQDVVPVDCVFFPKKTYQSQTSSGGGGSAAGLRMCKSPSTITSLASRDGHHHDLGGDNSSELGSDEGGGAGSGSGAGAVGSSGSFSASSSHNSAVDDVSDCHLSDPPALFGAEIVYSAGRGISNQSSSSPSAAPAVAAVDRLSVCRSSSPPPGLILSTTSLSSSSSLYCNTATATATATATYLDDRHRNGYFFPRGRTSYATTSTVAAKDPNDKWSQRRRALCYALLGVWTLIGAVAHRLYHAREEHVIEMIRQTFDSSLEARDALATSERSIQTMKRSEVTLVRVNHRLKAETEATVRHLATMTKSKSSKSASGRGGSDEGNDLENHNDEDDDDDDDDFVDPDSVRESYEKVRARTKMTEHRLGALEESLQEISRRYVIEKYGPGPHYVQFDLDFSQVEQMQQQSTGRSTSFTVRMAPLSLMPHTVHLFLEQVHRGLWDGCSFVINADHLVKVAPLSMDGATNLATPFVESDLAFPSFVEYSDDYPHKYLTLGFVGNAEAWGFFINTLNNSKLHAKGRQPHHDKGGGDPCFGAVVAGAETILRLTRVPTTGGMFMNAPVGIIKAKIIDESEIVRTRRWFE